MCCATAPEKPGCAPLLRVLGLLNADATLSPDKLKKYRQLNAMCQAIEHAVGGALRQRSDRPLLFVDLCSGSSSHLALLLAFSARFRWERPAHILAVDADATRVVAAKQRASLLGFRSETLHYITSRVASLDAWEKVYAAGFPAAAAAATGRGVRPPHGVFALHACDTATDEAIAFAVRSRARALLIAPCCQAELASAWRALASDTAAGPTAPGAGSGFALIHRQPNLRRELAAHVTDAFRLSLLRAQGYSVGLAEFVGAEHTPKNRLFTALRHQRRPGEGDAGLSEHRARTVALAEYKALRDATGGCGIALAKMLGAETRE